MAVKSFDPANIRNIVLVGHGGCGKTSLAEAVLFVTGATNRLGRVDDHTSIMDFEPEEQKRGGSTATSLAWTEHQGVKINILDTPGDQNFLYDAYNGMRGADAAVVVVSAPDGVEVNTERVIHEARALGLPIVLFINKMDRDRANPAEALTHLQELAGVEAVPVQVPIGAEHDFKGVVSLFQKKAFLFKMDGSGTYDKADIPSELEAAVESAWMTLVEAVATTDDALMEKYLETLELSDQEIRDGFQAAVRGGKLIPVIYGAATSAVGAPALVEVTSWALPSPLDRAAIEVSDAEGNLSQRAASPDEPFLARVIHTTIDEHSGKLSIYRVFSGTLPSDGHVVNASHGAAERVGSSFLLRGNHRETAPAVVCGDIVGVPKLKDTHTGDTLSDPKSVFQLPKIEYPPPMMAYVIRPSSKGDEDKLKTALDRVLEEDPTLSVTIDSLTHQVVLQGQGQAQLDMAIEKMKRKYRVSVDTDLPPVPYRETIRKPVLNVEGKHKKQTGGAGQFGVCFLNVTPGERGVGFEFVDKISGGAIPRQFIPSVEKGIRERLKSGFLAGYPIEDIHVELIDGKYHAVDSKDVAFQMAGSKGLRAAFEKGGSVLLEPLYGLQIVVPTENMGDVLGDITSRRGRVAGLDTRGNSTVINATAPLAEVQRYAPDLRAMTGGKGSFVMSLSGYEEVPSHLVHKIVEASPFHVQDAED